MLSTASFRADPQLIKELFMEKNLYHNTKKLVVQEDQRAALNLKPIDLHQDDPNAPKLLDYDY